MSNYITIKIVHCAEKRIEIVFYGDLCRRRHKSVRIAENQAMIFICDFYDAMRLQNGDYNDNSYFGYYRNISGRFRRVELVV